MTPVGTRMPTTASQLASIVWRRRLVVALVALISLVVGFGVVLTRPNVYESRSSVALLPVASNSGILPNYPNLITSLVPTYVQLVSSPVLLNQVAAKLPFHISPAQLANEVHGESLSNAAIIDIVADSSKATRARLIAAATTAAFLKQLRGNGVVVPKIYGQPSVSDTPASPKRKLLLPLIAILAVLLGLAAGLLWDRLFASGGRAGDGSQGRDIAPRDAVGASGVEGASRSLPAAAPASGGPGQQQRLGGDEVAPNDWVGAVHLIPATTSDGPSSRGDQPQRPYDAGNSEARDRPNQPSDESSPGRPF